ncbi:hypothetical protein Ccrd_010184 [Cynara cardunculus var. scolymus]|uniref:Uncharacterized protein n=1 Tax=Cynara cardunculus var. scolymus TaxID=59895 RepID=A0A103YLV0_CYNCS|nr:hypothetical protein Ccrd_010184 [Cynara cardunculus var. scolymus]
MLLIFSSLHRLLEQQVQFQKLSNNRLLRLPILHMRIRFGTSAPTLSLLEAKSYRINFDVDLSLKIVVDVIDLQMGRSFKNHRAKLQEHFLKCHGQEDVERAKGMKPTDSNVTNDAWHILCDYWSSEKFHVNCFWILICFVL